MALSVISLPADMMRTIVFPDAIPSYSLPTDVTSKSCATIFLGRPDKHGGHEEGCGSGGEGRTGKNGSCMT